MIRQPCFHGLVMPKGLRCDRGYVQVLVKSKGHYICKNFGHHTKDTQEVAEIWLSDRRKEQRDNLIGIVPEIPSKRFGLVAETWFKMWCQQKDAQGNLVHNEESQYKAKKALEKSVIPYFKDFKFDEVRPLDVEKWRESLQSRMGGTTINRYQCILSSIYSHVDKWVQTERIKPAFKVPLKNPCGPVEKAKAHKRTRILTKYEGSKLKLAFKNLKDEDGWEICKLALKSVLSLKDLKHLEIGSEIDIERSKTGVPVNLRLPVLVNLNWANWRKRWESARSSAGLSDVQFRDLRKTGINWLKGRHDLKLVSEYAGHADIKTTEASYTIRQAEYLEPLTKDLERQVDEL